MGEHDFEDGLGGLGKFLDFCKKNVGFVAVITAFLGFGVAHMTSPKDPTVGPDLKAIKTELDQTYLLAEATANAVPAIQTELASTQTELRLHEKGDSISIGPLVNLRNMISEHKKLSHGYLAGFTHGKAVMQ